MLILVIACGNISEANNALQVLCTLLACYCFHQSHSTLLSELGRCLTKRNEILTRLCLRQTCGGWYVIQDSCEEKVGGMKKEEEGQDRIVSACAVRLCILQLPQRVLRLEKARVLLVLGRNLVWQVACRGGGGDHLRGGVRGGKKASMEHRRSCRGLVGGRWSRCWGGGRRRGAGAG